MMLSETLTAMRQQRPYLRGNAERKRAYREGRRYWKRYWGGLLVVQVRRHLGERRFGEAFRGTRAIARHRPAALPLLLRPSRSEPA
jgi:hypothetical protein